MVGQDEPDPDAALARELREAGQERLADPAALMTLGDVDLVDEELCAIAVSSGQLVREHEPDRIRTVERHEEERPRIGQQSLRIPRALVRAESLDDGFIAGTEETNLDIRRSFHGEESMPSKSANVKNEKQYEALKDKGMSKERAAKIANSPGASSRGGKASGSGTRRNNTSQGGTTAQKKAAGRKGGKATASKS